MARTPEDFGGAFTDLLTAADLTPDGVLQHVRPGVVARSTLYTWKNGRNLPEDTAPLQAVVEVCLQRAAGADLGAAPGDVAGWMALLTEAKQTRDSRAAQHRTIAPGGDPRGLVDGIAGSGAGGGGAGRFIGRWDPVRLGVHRAIGAQALPPYVRRAHDHLLYALLDPAPAANRLVVLRGGSSTGKSRAAYEAVQDRLPGWPVVYPRTAAALTRLLQDGIAARSVLWLNELRDYADDPAGSDALFALADLLTGRDHIVALTALWPDFWKTYTTDPRGGRPGEPDPTRAVRQLLAPLPDLTGHAPADADARAGGVLDIADHFTGQDLNAARRYGDHALDEAITAAERAGAAGQVTQYLAGVFDLLDQYQGPGADPFGQALITAAMDATRMGCSPPLSATLLQHAAVGYLTPRHRALSQERWNARMQDGWAYATRLLKGAVQALEPVPPEHGIGVTGYRLADYLDQHGRTHRAGHIPPLDFWAATATHAHPHDLSRLGDAAWNRGLYRAATQLHKNATAHGDPWAACTLMIHLHELHPFNTELTAWLAAHTNLADPAALAYLLSDFLQVWAYPQATALLARNPAAHVALDDPESVVELLVVLLAVNTDDPKAMANMDLGVAAERQVIALAERAAAAQVALGNHAAPYLFSQLRWAGVDERVIALLNRKPAAQATTGIAQLRKLQNGIRLLEQRFEDFEQERVKVTAPTDRLPALGMFRKFLKVGKHAERYRFGREPDGRPADRWGWDDLD